MMMAATIASRPRVRYETADCHDGQLASHAAGFVGQLGRGEADLLTYEDAHVAGEISEKLADRTVIPAGLHQPANPPPGRSLPMGAPVVSVK